MRKLAVLLVLIVVLGAGYYVYWNKKAEDFKQMAVQAIDSLNAVEKPFTKDKTFFTYSSISVTGFPSTMVVEVAKPVAEVPISALMDEIQKQKGINKPLPYEWIEEISYGDKITFTGNIWGDHITFSTNGDHTEKALINKAPRHTLVGSTSTPLVCSLSVEQVKGVTPWTFRPVFTNPKVFFNAFRSFDCAVRGISVKDAINGAPIYTGDAVAFSVGNEPTGNAGNHKMHFRMDLDKQKYTAAGDTVMYDYMLMFYTLMGQADQVSPMAASEFGEHNLKIDMSYDGPLEPQYFSDPGLNLHFDVNALNAETALSTLTFQTHVASVPQGSDRALSISMHGKGNVSERYDQLMQKRLVSVLKNMNTPENQAKLEMDPVMQMYHKIAALGTPEDTVAKLYPQFHTFGPSSFDFDLDIKGPNDNAKFMRQATVALDDMDWVTTPYGIKSKGSANASTPGKPPVADLSITCIACDALVNDLGNYVMRVETLMSQLGKEPAGHAFLTKDLLDGTRQFLHGIAENANAKDLVIHFVMRGNGNFTISGKQLPEVMALYMTTIAPRMPQPSPSAGGQPQLSAPPSPPGQ